MAKGSALLSAITGAKKPRIYEVPKKGDVVNLAVTARVGNINTSESEKGKKSCHTDLTITAIADLGGGKK